MVLILRIIRSELRYAPQRKKQSEPVCDGKKRLVTELCRDGPLNAAIRFVVDVRGRFAANEVWDI